MLCSDSATACKQSLGSSVNHMCVFFSPLFFSQGLEKSLDDHKILLLEAAPDRPQKITSVYSNRVSNITPGSKRLLESKCYLIIIL